MVERALYFDAETMKFVAGPPPPPTRPLRDTPLAVSAKSLGWFGNEDDRVEREEETEIARLSEENKHLRDSSRELNEQVQLLKEQQKTLETMTALVGVSVESFLMKKFLGSGSNAATFQVEFVPRRNMAHSQPSSTVTTLSPPSSTMLAMKVLFNWENTPQQTLIKQKYMKECLILACVPLHPNIIHPLGTLVIPRLPQEFVDVIPQDQPVYKDLALNKSLAFLMPFCGVPLGKFFTSMTTPSPMAIVKNLLGQALSAVCHLERAQIVHRDIKEDNVLVDPQTQKLTVIDFGEAEECVGDNLNLMVLRTGGQVWGNTGTMPPEVSVISKNLVRMLTPFHMFSYTKCDSFSLALVFYDTLLPPTNKFIEHFNRDMSTFNPALLPPLPPVFRNSTLSRVLIAMMSCDRAERLSASAALVTLNTP
ncbi:hypothetical protein Pelo_1799 [Pelomyxa schiedti]|nr:hypothetical protein Pelo_1799 [Pelomyxa schiedti]